MASQSYKPKLVLGHSTLAARDLDGLLAFYSDVLGFEITNRGPAGNDGAEIAFLSQDPSFHHQIAMVKGIGVPDSDFVMVDHLAFQTGSLDDLRMLRANLIATGIENIMPISHGNAWSLYFQDPEGNGIECFVDTPFHVAQPHAEGFNLDQSDEEIVEETRRCIESDAEFRPFPEWREEFTKRLDRS
jgi:catechol 2,3-dioxygenase